MLIRRTSNKRANIEESKNMTLVKENIEQENQLLHYEINKMKEEFQTMEDLKDKVNYDNNRFLKL